jgi:hypothetical protein
MKFSQDAATKALKAVSAPVGYSKKNRTGAWKNVPDRHQDAISHYTGNGYAALYDALREGKASASQLAYTALLDEALAIAPKYAGRSTRGIPLSGPKSDKFLKDHLTAWKKRRRRGPSRLHLVDGRRHAGVFGQLLAAHRRQQGSARELDQPARRHRERSAAQA